MSNQNQSHLPNSTPSAHAEAPAPAADTVLRNPTQTTHGVGSSDLFDEQTQFALKIKRFDHYASSGICPPQPERDGIHFEDLPSPYCGQYKDTSLTAAQDHQLGQGFDLQVWLAMDASQTLVPGCETLWPAPGADSSSEQLAHVGKCLHKKRDALLNFQSLQLQRLQQHVVLTQAFFEGLCSVAPTDMCTTPMPEDCLALMRKASIDIPVRMNPLELYKTLSRRLLVQEQEVIAIGMELLRDELELVRLGFYEAAGQFLKDQAQTILAACDELEAASPLDKDDEVHQTLRAVLEDPIYTLWPAPEQPDISGFMGKPGTLCPPQRTTY